MDTHIKNGPIDAFRSLFVRLKGHSKGIVSRPRSQIGNEVLAEIEIASE